MGFIFKYILILLIPFLTVGRVDAKDFSMEIIKDKHLLRVKDGDTTVKEYKCSVGKGGLGKRMIGGDNKTPAGVYHVVAMNSTSHFHFFIYLGYPDTQDAFDGLKSGLISKKEFTRIKEAEIKCEVPPSDTNLGGVIGIHGLKNGLEWLGHLHLLWDWTKGCIAVTDSEIDEIKTFCKVGTVVVIKESINS